MPESDFKPTLVVDAGSSRIKTALLAPVEGAPRLLCDVAVPNTPAGPTCQGSPAEHALHELQAMTGWRMLEQGQIVQSSVGGTVISSSVAAPTRVILLSGVESALAAMESRVVAIDSVEIVVAASLENRQGAKESKTQGLARHLHGVRAAAVLVGARSPKEAGIMAALIRSSAIFPELDRLRVLFAGGTDCATTLQTDLAECDFQHLSTADWVTAEFPQEQLSKALRPTNGTADTDSSVFAGLTPYSDAFVAPTGVNSVIRLLSQKSEGAVCMIDVGGQKTSIMCADSPSGSKRYVGDLQPHEVHLRMGTDRGLRNVLRVIPPASIQEWLPFDIGDEDLRNYLGNRTLRPGLPAQDVRELLVEQAVARACGLAARKGAMTADLIIASGGIAAYPRLGQSLLTLLDIAQPAAPCRLLVDSTSMLPRLGALAQVDAAAALALLRDDVLVNLGCCLSLAGKARQGEIVAEIGVQRGMSTEGSQLAEEVYEIRFGTITLIPLRAEEDAGIRVAAGRKFSFGIETSGSAWSAGSARTGKDPAASISGGLFGLIIDARGRPIELAHNAAQRQARLSDWLRAVDAFDAEVFSRLD